MGMPPYGCVPPTGYSMAAEAWENQGDLLARFNFATNLTTGKVGGLTFDPANLLMLGLVKSADLPKTKATMAGEHTGVDLAIALIEDALLQGDFSPANDAVVRRQLQDPDVARQMAASPISGLRLVSSFVLASPDFQHR
jgi:hypothetical protein